MAGNVFVPPIFRTAPAATLIVPPPTVVPRFAVNEERSRVPLATIMFPAAADEELRGGRLPVRDFVVVPLIRNVP